MAVRIAVVETGEQELTTLVRETGFTVACTIAPEELNSLERRVPPPEVLLLDLRGHPSLPPELAPLRRRLPGMAVVVVASSYEPALMLEAMRAGVNEFVSDPVARPDLEAAITRVAGERPSLVKGEVLAFVGAKGGVGTTTTAVNVATALAALVTGGRCLLVDFHQAGGDAALFLGVEPKFSILDALENTQRLDTTFLHGIVTRTPATNLDLLASPDRVAAEQVEPSKIRAVTSAAAAAYKYTVLDLPRSDSAMMDGLDHVSRIIVVANQELATVRSAARLTATLRQRYGADKVMIVLTRSDRQADIGHEDVERTVGAEVAHVFPSDYRVALNALNKGRPVVIDNHNDLAASFRRFARQVAGVRPEAADVSRTGLLGRLTQRRA